MRVSLCQGKGEVADDVLRSRVGLTLSESEKGGEQECRKKKKLVPTDSSIPECSERRLEKNRLVKTHHAGNKITY